MRVKASLAVIAVAALAAVATMVGCAVASSRSSAGGEGSACYKQISQSEAQELMKSQDGYVIVDVRRQDEFDSGHIPGAICIPNESIDTERPAELPDLDQLIMVYCRSGNRSKKAAEKLAKMGYTNVVEFGGIKTWPGEVVVD